MVFESAICQMFNLNPSHVYLSSLVFPDISPSVLLSATFTCFLFRLSYLFLMEHSIQYSSLTLTIYLTHNYVYSYMFIVTCL